MDEEKTKNKEQVNSLERKERMEVILEIVKKYPERLQDTVFDFLTEDLEQD
jgi:hypothetical protein